MELQAAVHTGQGRHSPHLLELKTKLLGNYENDNENNFYSNNDNWNRMNVILTPFMIMLTVSLRSDDRTWVAEIPSQNVYLTARHAEPDY